MNLKSKLGWLFSAAPASSITLGPLPASALPGLTSVAMGSQGGEVQPVQWRRGGPGHRGPRWYGPGPGAAILGGVIIGSALMAAAIAEKRASRSDLRRCARDFPDFDPRSGTYVDRSGDVRVCPYLY